MQKTCIKEGPPQSYPVRKMPPLAALLLGLLVLVGRATENPKVISSFSIPGEWVEGLLPPEINHRSLVGPKSETHSYQLSPRDVRDLSNTALIVGCSKITEPFLYQWVTSNHREKDTLWLEESPGIPALPTSHAWTNPKWVKLMVQNLATQLHNKFPHLNLETALHQKLKEVDETDAKIESYFNAIPSNQRALITQHPNLGPFADRYQLNIIDTILPSASAELTDLSVQKYRSLLQSIRTHHIRVIVIDEGESSALAKNLTISAQIPPPLPLSFEYLQPAGTPGSTWSAMMLLNAERLKAALASN